MRGIQSVFLIIVLLGCEEQKTCSEMYHSKKEVVESFRQAEKLYGNFKIGDYVRIDQAPWKGVEGRIMSMTSPNAICDPNSGVASVGMGFSVFVRWPEVEIFDAQFNRSYYEVDLRDVSKKKDKT